MEPRGAMKIRAGVGVVMIAAFFAALTLSSAPQLHNYLHKSAAPHECAATIVASGNYHHAPAPSLLAVAPLSPVALIDCAPKPDLLAVSFLSSILERAPPSAI